MGEKFGVHKVIKARGIVTHGIVRIQVTNHVRGGSSGKVGDSRLGAGGGKPEQQWW